MMQALWQQTAAVVSVALAAVCCCCCCCCKAGCTSNEDVAAADVARQRTRSEDAYMAQLLLARQQVMPQLVTLQGPGNMPVVHAAVVYKI
jgi:hypothetical protein